MTAPAAAGSTGGIVLAAGESSRMGRPKALLRCPEGVTFVDAVIQSLKRGGVDRVVVVLGHDADVIVTGAGLQDAMWVLNERYREGQLSSLRRGLAELTDVDAVIVALVDQPHVASEVVARLVSEFQSSRAPVIRPVWKGRGGHPILLSSEAFPEVKSPHTATLYDVVKKFRDRRRDVAVADSSILMDFDTPADLSRLDDLTKHSGKNLKP
jgi:CTP:molybdopterin cytidylyltransferase MocA